MTKRLYEGSIKIIGLRPKLMTAINTIKLEIEKLRGSFIPSRLQTITLT